MEHVCLDLEGVLIPEIWAEVANYTGEDQFKLTTQDLKDYSELMDMRIDLVRSIGLTFPEIQNLLNIEGSELKGYTLRQLENKKKVIKSLKDMKFKVFASGDSYNDIQMLQEADLGVFFQAPKHIREEFQEIGGVESHQELKELLISNSSFVGR